MIDVNAKTFDDTAFSLACQGGFSDVVKIFLDNAAALSIDLNVMKSNGWTGFHYACDFGHLDVVKIIMENTKVPMENGLISSVDLNAKTKKGDTGFHMACSYGYEKIVELMLNNSDNLKLDLAFKNNLGETGFQIAHKLKDKSVVDLIEFRRPDLNKEAQQEPAVFKPRHFRCPMCCYTWEKMEVERHIIGTHNMTIDMLKTMVACGAIRIIEEIIQ